MHEEVLAASIPLIWVFSYKYVERVWTACAFCEEHTGKAPGYWTIIQHSGLC